MQLHSYYDLQTYGRSVIEYFFIFYGTTCNYNLLKSNLIKPNLTNLTLKHLNNFYSSRQKEFIS